MIESGKIIATHGNNAVVEINRTEKCNGCTACHTFGSDKVRVEAENSSGAAAGDTVQVNISSDKVVRNSMLVFIFPLLAMIAAYFAGLSLAQSDGEGAGILGAVFGFIISLFIVNLIDRKWGKHEPAAAKIINITPVR